jgi:hypothetical protein
MTQRDQHWIESIEDIEDFLANVIVCAPDDFIELDFLPATEQLNLDRAFVELERGMKLLVEAGVEGPRLGELRRLLDESLLAYKSGDAKAGAHRLSEFGVLAFDNPDFPG